jgi:hypothetical protein
MVVRCIKILFVALLIQEFKIRNEMKICDNACIRKNMAWDQTFKKNKMCYTQWSYH